MQKLISIISYKMPDGAGPRPATGAGHVKCEIVLQTAIIKKQLINPMRWQQVAQMPIHNYGAAAMAKRFAGRMNYVVNAAHTKRTLHEQGLLTGWLPGWPTGSAGWSTPSPVDAVVISMVNENTASCKWQVALMQLLLHSSSSSSCALISK